MTYGVNKFGEKGSWGRRWMATMLWQGRI